MQISGLCINQETKCINQETKCINQEIKCIKNANFVENFSYIQIKNKSSKAELQYPLDKIVSNKKPFVQFHDMF